MVPGLFPVANIWPHILLNRTSSRPPASAEYILSRKAGNREDQDLSKAVPERSMCKAHTAIADLSVPIKSTLLLGRIGQTSILCFGPYRKVHTATAASESGLAALLPTFGVNMQVSASDMHLVSFDVIS